MNKRGQVTIFIIIAILVLGAVVMYFVFRDDYSLNNSFTEADAVRTFTESCIKETATDVIYEVGSGGGYYFPPKYSTQSGVVYYWGFDNVNHLPTKEFVEEQISIYASENIKLCTKEFSQFSDLKVNEGNIEVVTSIKNDRVVLDVVYPLTISKANQSTTINSFDNLEIPIRVGVIYNAVNEMSKYTYGDSGICLDCLNNISLKNNLNINMADYQNNSVVFTISDAKVSLNENETFEWVFANKY
jgi:hypothetical protein